MPSLRLVLSCAAAVAAVSAALLADRAPAPVAPVPVGHLVLVIEGDAGALRVRQVVAKPDPCGPVHRLQSPYRISVRDAAGTELGDYPLDLSAFDLDPARRGAPDRVEGCRVVSSEVMALASIPHWPQAASIALRGPNGELGAVAGDELRTLVRAGGGR